MKNITIPINFPINLTNSLHVVVDFLKPISFLGVESSEASCSIIF